MILCTECYVQQGDKTLMMYRNKKDADINAGKWVGLGGKFEAGESPEQCLLREAQEEAGITLTSYRLRGMVTFMTTNSADDQMLIFVYTADGFTGTPNMTACSEGSLQWVNTDAIGGLNLWAGDRLFWEWMQQDKGLFSARFVYDGEDLVQHDVSFYL
jgi:8-oxo-dGTP diphosphatase